MSTWQKKRLSTKYIKVTRPKAFLISMPQNSKFRDFSFWFPRKLLKRGFSDYDIVLNYPNDFEFKLIRKNPVFKHFKSVAQIFYTLSEVQETDIGVIDNLIIPSSEFDKIKF